MQEIMIWPEWDEIDIRTFQVFSLPDSFLQSSNKCLFAFSREYRSSMTRGLIAGCKCLWTCYLSYTTKIWHTTPHHTAHDSFGQAWRIDLK